MAEESEDGQEKTEEPTSRKLEKAAEDGQVLTSKEMFVFTGIIMMFGLVYIIPYFSQMLLSSYRAMINDANSILKNSRSIENEINNFSIEEIYKQMIGKK